MKEKFIKIYWSGDSKNIIGKKVRELRKQQKISQRTLAARLTLAGTEFTELTILRIEKGIRFVPDYEIVVIADYFHVSADYLLGKDTCMPPERSDASTRPFPDNT